MKKILSLLVCAVMLMGTLPVSAANSKDLLEYGSFETKSSGVYSATMRPTEYSEDVAHTGDVSIKAIGNEAHQWALMTFKMPTLLEKNKTYHISMWLYSKGDVAKISPDIVYVIGGVRKTLALKGGTIPVGKWVHYEDNFEIVDDTDNAITSTSLQVDVNGLYDTYIDDIELYAGEREVTPLENWNDADPEQQEIKGETLDLYVDQNAADGGNGSKDAPFNSIYAARDYVRTINKDMDKNIAVNIKQGFYEMTETFKLTEEDSGSNGYYVIWRANGDEEVVLSGGRKVTGWVESEIPGVYKASNIGDNMRNLFVNNAPATRARVEEYVTPLSWYNDETDATSEKDGVVIPKGIIKNPEAATNLELFKLITFHGNWAVKGKAIETEAGTAISFAQPAFAAQERSNYSILTWNITDDFRLENALEFLDKPGEWYQDIDTDTLYYMPKEGENIYESEIVAPVLENMIDIAGSSSDNQAHHIAFEGFTIAHGGNDYTSRRGRATHQATSLYTFDDTYGYQSGWYMERANINVNNSSHILFSDNVIKHMSSVGISVMTGSEECIFDGNVFYHMASAAMTVGSSRATNVLDRDLIPRNITFSNNIVTETGFEYPDASAFQAYFANGVYVLNNVVYDTYYSGICAGWGWNTSPLPQRRFNVIGNRVWNTNMFGQDGAPIYTLGDAPKSTAQYNYISYVPDGHPRPQFYHDEGSAHWYDYRNVIFTGLPARTGNWISPYNVNQHDLVLVENYTDNEKRRYVAEDTIETNTGFNPDGSWSEAARGAIEKSGLSEDYEHLYSKVPGWQEQCEKIKNVTLQTKEQDNATPVKLKTGESANLRALYEAYNGELTFKESFASVKSSDTSVVKCDGAKITAVGSGIANIIAVTDDGYELMITVTVDDKGEKVELLATDDIIGAGEVTYLKYVLDTKYWKYTPANSTHEFTSSNPHIATVDDMGIVRGLKNGQTTITLKVTYDGQVFYDSVELMIKEQSVAAQISLDKHIYEKNEDKQLDAKITEGDKVITADVSNTDASFTDAAGVERSGDIDAKYTAEMRRLYSSEIISGSYNASDNLTEEEFTVMVEKATGRTRKDMDIQVKDGLMTRERMAYILAQALRYVWGNTMAGATRLSFVADRADISPEYVQAVATVEKYELCFINESGNVFRPKDMATVAEASATIFRMLYPTEIRNRVYPDGWFNRAYEGEDMGRRSHSIMRTDENKTIVETAAVDKGDISIPDASGNYKVNVKSSYNGAVLETNDYCFVYDKNDIYASDELNIDHIGTDASGIVLSEDDKIRIISETGDVWNKEDVFSYAYKNTSDENYEITTTVDSITNTDSDVAAGIMVRASTDSDAIKIDYRIKTSGQTFLCWRTSAGDATYFSQGKTLEFPATLRLVKNGTKFTAFYKDGDKWIEDMSYDVSGLNGTINAGLMLYSMTTRSGVPCSAVYSDNYFGAERQLDNVVRKETVQSQKPVQTQKPEDTEKPVEENEVFTIDRGRYLDAFTNGGFERGVSGWKVGSGEVFSVEEAYKGDSALAYRPNGGSGYTTYSLSGISQKKTYYLVFRAKTEKGTTTFSPYIQYHNGSANVRCNVEYMTDRTANADEWKEIIMKMTFDGPVSSPLLVLYVTGSSTVYVDNMELLYK